MKKFLIVSTLFLGFTVSTMGQQDPMFTKYMFNTLSYNPAFAGSRDYMSFGVLHRTQWINIDGAPTTQTFTFETPIKAEKVGIGLNVFKDNIGPTNHFGAYATYAYHIPVTQKGKLSIGLQGGITRFTADYTEVKISNNDQVFGQNVSRNMGNFGFALYYYTDRFYAMFSVPHFVEHDLRDFEDITTDFYARYYRNYYAGIGGAIPVRGEDIIFKPSLLIKKVRLFKGIRTEEAFEDISAPTAFDLDMSFLFYQKLWLGTAFRSAIENFDNERSSNSSIDLWASYFLQNGLRLGLAYDFSINELRSETPGSFEIFVGYEFNYKKSKIVTPRYF